MQCMKRTRCFSDSSMLLRTNIIVTKEAQHWIDNRDDDIDNNNDNSNESSDDDDNDGGDGDEDNNNND